MFLVAFASFQLQSAHAASEHVAIIREQTEQAEYHFATVGSEPEVWSAPNRSQGLRSRVSAAGIELFPRETDSSGTGAPWKLQLRTSHFGRQGDASGLLPALVRAEANRFAINYGSLIEWFENRDDGIEQGWTLSSPPHGTGLVWIGLEVQGDLDFRVDVTASSGVFVNGEGEPHIRYHGLHAWDANGRPLDARLLSSQHGLGIGVNDDYAVYPITVDPILSGPQWTAEGDQASALMGAAVASAGDVNGDGYSDVIVGAYLYDNGQLDEGRAYVYLGSPSGLQTSPAWLAESDQAFANFGVAVACAGDVNGDGYSDVIVGAHRYDNGQADEGRVFVYHGSPAGPSITPDATREVNQATALFGYSVASAGNVNGDAYSDVIVGAYSYTNGETDEGRAVVYLGTAGGLASTPTWLAESDQAHANYGACVAAAGDVNRDGYGDVIVAAPRYDNGEADEGRTSLYLGSQTGLSPLPVWEKEGNSANALFGNVVTSAWDVNGDGFGDVAVATEAGDIQLYAGSNTSLSADPVWTIAIGAGCLVGSAGDANSDGFADIVAGYPYNSACYVYVGSPNWPSSDIAWSVYESSSNLGAALACAGDVNGDGYSDLLIGAPSFTGGESYEGRAITYHGSPSGLASEQAWESGSNQTSSYFGVSVSGALDVNSDGYDDLLVGAPLFDNGHFNEGRAFLFLGSSTGLANSAAWTAEGDQANAFFGGAVSKAGDVNGDGYSDVLVGAPHYGSSPPDEGRVSLYYGTYSGLSLIPSWTAEGDHGGSGFGSAVSWCGDVNGDGYADFMVGAPGYDVSGTDDGLAFAYYGAPTGPIGPTWVSSCSQSDALYGSSVARAGDVNADGYCDIVVGAPRYDGVHVDGGSVYVVLGSSLGLASAPAWSYEGDANDARYGSAVAGAGDINADGFADVIVGAPNYALAAGRVALFLGGSSGLAHIWSFDGLAYSLFGQAVDCAGDVNLDGFSDIVVGASAWNSYPYGQTGRCFTFLGSASGIPGFYNWSASVLASGAQFGESVCGAGDVNGDGYSDIAVGAPNYSGSTYQAGGAFCYLGNQGRTGWVQAPQQRQLVTGQPIPILGESRTHGFTISAALSQDPSGFLSLSPSATEVRLEVEPEPVGQGTFDGFDTESGLPVPVGSVPVVFESAVGNLQENTLYRWRARFCVNNPLFPATPWFTLSGTAPTQGKVRAIILPAAGKALRRGTVGGMVTRSL